MGEESDEKRKEGRSNNQSKMKKMHSKDRVINESGYCSALVLV